MIPVYKETEEQAWGFTILENCCFCRMPTPFWNRNADVACCQDCAENHEVSDLPTKREWVDKERRLSPRPMWRN